MVADALSGPIATDVAPQDEPPHALSSREIATRQGVALDVGLSLEQAAARLRLSGPNRLPEAPPRTPLSVLAAQFRGAFVLVLLAAAVVAGAVGDLKDAAVILAVMLLNGVLGFYQEYRAERSLLALRRMLPRVARVRRGGAVAQIPVEDVVPGDVVLFEAGDRAPADARLVFSAGLEADESGLTGESVPVAKDAAAVLPGDTPLAERRNLVFMNTTITRGRGEAVVTATGGATAIGALSRELAEAPEPRSPLQRQLDAAGRRLGAVALGLVALLLTFALLRGEPLLHVVLESVSLAVAAMPEGLPAVVTVVLALGMRRLARRHALVKRLAGVETLGCATVICTDKTGTLTLNQMTVRAVLAPGGAGFAVTGEGYAGAGTIEPEGEEAVDLQAALRAGVVCNDSRIVDGRTIGDPTEAALLALAPKGGLDPETERQRHPRIAEVPFDAAHKFMATFHREGDGVRLYVKGAPDVLMPLCASQRLGGRDVPLVAAARAELQEAYAGLAGRGLRGLLLATRTLPAAAFDPSGKLAEEVRDLCFLGLLGIADPPRPEARDAIAACREAGIAVKMITGDHPETGAAIGRELGLAGRAVTGAELDRMDSPTLTRNVAEADVFARVAPEHKIRIVRALQAQGHVVAMTGDGVNDAPALKGADIGVAMGVAGTEVAKEAATVVLTDDNFATIVTAVREGRALYDNIVKFVRFQLSTTVGAVATVFLAPQLGLPDPLAPIQILWVAMIMDGPPAVALGFDAARPGLMGEPPRDPKAQILSGRRLAHVLSFGAVMTAGTLAVLAWALETGTREHALTLAFTTFVLFQMFNIFNARAEAGSAFNRTFFRNRLLWLSLVGVLALQVAAIHWPPLAALFGTVPLTVGDWALAVAVASSVLLLEEARKLLLATSRRT